MLRRIIGLILVCVGTWIFAQGWSRKDSLLGSISETGTSIANKFDGGSRTPKHMLYLTGGSLLIVSGAIVAFSGRRSG
jgi:hypothetical protein